MLDKTALCEKIRSIYPDIGECGLDLNVVFDEENDAWVVDLKKGRIQLKTFLDDGDADACMLGKKCIGLGIQITLLRDSIEKLEARKTA